MIRFDFFISMEKAHLDSFLFVFLFFLFLYQIQNSWMAHKHTLTRTYIWFGIQTKNHYHPVILIVHDTQLSTLLYMLYCITLLQQMRTTKKYTIQRYISLSVSCFHVFFPQNFVIKMNKYCKIRNRTFGIVIFRRKC